MTLRTKGDMCVLTTRDETTYGKVSTTETSVYSGTLDKVSCSDEQTTDEVIDCGSMVRADILVIGRSFGLSASFYHKRAQGWSEWLGRVLGDSTTRKDLPSFCAEYRVGASEYHLHTGCKVDTLTMAASDIGAPILFTADMMCRWHTVTPFKDADGTGLTMDMATHPSAAPLTYNSFWTVGTETVKAKSWTLSIARSLQGEPDSTGNADSWMKLEAGAGSTEQDLQITLELTIDSQGPAWDLKRLAGAKDLTAKLVLDGKTITLTGCILGAGMPDRSQGAYDETISLSAADVTVA